jgi:TOBE domain
LSGEAGVEQIPRDRLWSDARVTHVEYLGSLTRVGVQTAATGDRVGSTASSAVSELTVQIANVSDAPLPYCVGDGVRVSFAPDSARMLTAS